MTGQSFCVMIIVFVLFDTNLDSFHFYRNDFVSGGRILYRYADLKPGTFLYIHFDRHAGREIGRLVGVFFLHMDGEQYDLCITQPLPGIYSDLVS